MDDDTNDETILVDQSRPHLARWRRRAAMLVYDSRQDPRTPGSRGVAIGDPRLMYQAGQVQVDLEVRPSAIPGRLRVLGQVTADTAELAHAWIIVEGASGRRECEIDALGQFLLDGLVPGPHRMEVGLAYELVEIPALLL